MPTHHLDRNNLSRGEDWVGNNAAFTCPKCQRVFLVSGLIHPNGRPCPGCGASVGFCDIHSQFAYIKS